MRPVVRILLPIENRTGHRIMHTFECIFTHNSRVNLLLFIYFYFYFIFIAISERR